MSHERRKTIKKLPIVRWVFTGLMSIVLPVDAMDIMVKKKKNNKPSVKTICLHKEHGDKGHVSHDHAKMRAEKLKMLQSSEKKKTEMHDNQ